MEPFKEEQIKSDQPFPVDIFIQDNLKEHIIVPPHWHDCIEILYMIEGNSVQQVNDRRFGIKKHDLIIINGGDMHYTLCSPGEDIRILVVKFLPEILESSYKIFESKYILPFLNSGSKKNCYPIDTLNNSNEIHNILMGLYKEFTGEKQGYEIFIKGFIYQLIAYLIRDNILKIKRLYGNEKELIRFNKLFKYIENNYTEKIDMEKAAGLLNLSYYYFSRYFKKITGRSFKEYIDFVRIREVEKLLVSGDYNISQAAYEVGFTNISSFNRVFKRIKGYTPKSLLLSFSENTGKHRSQ